MTILKKNFKGVKKVIGFLTKISLLILLALTICTCNGPRLILGSQILESQIDYSIYSGRLAKQIRDAMACHTSKTDVRDFHSWHPGKWLIWQPYQAIHGLEYCPNLEPMRRKCSRIKLYPLVSTTPFSLSQYKTVWTGRRQSLHTAYQLQSLQEEDLIRKRRSRHLRDLTRRLTGKTLETMRMMERSSSYSSTMKAVSGKDRTISSTTGGLQKQR